MAYGVKYQATEKSLDGNNYTVKILQNGYAGSVIPFTLGTPAAVVRWGQERSDTYEPLRPSNVDAMIFEKNKIIQQDIFFADDDMFRLQIEKGAQVYWVGKILTDIFEDSLDIRLASSKLSAIDGLGQLENIAFEAETRVSFVQAIAEILAIGNLGLNIRVACNWFTPDILSTEDPLAKVQIERKALWDDDDKQISSAEALKQILLRFGLQLHQSNGVWWVIQRELLGASTFKYFEYNSNGSFISSQSGFNPAVTINATDQYGKRLSGGRRPFFPAYKTTTVLYFPKPDSGSVVPNGSFEEWDSPPTLPTGWIKSLSGLEVALERIAKEGSFSCSVPSYYHPDPNILPPQYIYRDAALISGGLNKLKVSIGAQLKKNPNNLTVPNSLDPRKTYFAIKYGNYWLKRDAQGALSWFLEGQGGQYDHYILFKNIGVEYGPFGWQADEFITPTVPQAVGQLTVRLYQLVEFEYVVGQESQTAAFSAVIWDDVKVEVLVVGETINQVEGVETVTTSIVLPNTVTKDAIEFSIGDGPSSLTPSRLTIGSTTLTGNWKRGPYAGENPTGKAIDSLLADTWMRAQKTPLEVHRATYTARPSADALIEAHNVLVIGSNRYAMSSLTRDLLAGHSEGEWILIQADDSDIITTTQAITKDSSTNKINRDTLFGDGNNVGSQTFASGFTGAGWKIEKRDGKYFLIIDGIEVRGPLSVSELLFMQKRTFNGSLLIGRTGTGKVKNISFVGG